jgi:hypothetical protein
MNSLKLLFCLFKKFCLIQRTHRLFRQKASTCHQLGAGMVEYLLILVITVSLVMALSRGVGLPIKRYIEDNVLGLVSCMLRVGQFPSKSFGICSLDGANLNVDFEGNVPNLGGENTGSGSGTSSRLSDSNTGGGSDGADGSSSGSNDSSQSGNSSEPSFRSSNSTGSINEGGNNPFDDVSSTSRINIGGDEDSNYDTKRELNISQNDGEMVSVQRFGKEDRIGGSFSIDGDEIENQQDSASASSGTKSQEVPESLLETTTPKSSFSIPKEDSQRDLSSIQDEGIDFSFMNIIKWVIIIAIFVIIGFFTFTQLNSIRKGWTD